jgi:hypothetical protein
MLRRAFSAPVALYVGLAVLAAAPFLADSFVLGAESAERHSRAVVQSILAGQLPFWNPWYCGGAVLWQNPVVSVIAPGYLLSGVMPLALAAKVNVALHYCAAGLGLYLLLRRVARIESAWVSAGAATALVFAASIALRAGMPRDEPLAILLLPWAAYVLLRPTGGWVRNAVLGALVLAVIVLDGGFFVVAVAAVMLGVAGVAARLERGTWMPLVASCLTVAAGAALAAPRVIPAAQFVMSDRVSVPVDGSHREDASGRGCRDAHALPRTARSDRPPVYGDGPVRIFDSRASPNQVTVRVAVLSLEPAATIVLNQNFSDGWSSNIGALVAEPGTGNPSIVLPRGFVGRVTFTFMPPGILLGAAIGLAAAVVCLVAWRRPDVAEAALARLDRASRPTRAVLAAHPLDLGVVAVAALGFLWIYWHYPYRPTLPNNGWWNYFDQGQYLRSARAFARGDWSPAEHVYPIGYPALAVPFINLSARDPFLPVNLTLFVAFAWFCYRLFRPVLGGPVAALVLFASLALPTEMTTPQYIRYPIWSQFVIPWTTNGVAPLYVGALLAIRFNWQRNRAAVDVLIGAVVGAVVCVRPADALPLAAIVAAYGIHVLMATRRPARLMLVAAGAVIGAAPFLLFMGRVYGGGVSPYMRNWRTVGFTFSNLNERAYQMLLRSEDTYGEVHSALFQLQPWLYVAVPLAIVWACVEPVVGAFAVVLALASWTLYLGYNDFSPFNILRFFLVHYLVWALPVLAAAGLAGAVHIARNRRWFLAGAVCAVAVFAWGVRLVPSAVAVNQVRKESSACCGDAYALSFASPQDLDAIDVDGVSYGNPIVLALKDMELDADGERVDAFSSYRVLRRPGGIRIIFNGNVSASRVEFRLDNSLDRLRETGTAVRPIRFHATLFGWRLSAGS